MTKWPQAKFKGSWDHLDYPMAACCACNFPQTETLHPAGKLLKLRVTVSQRLQKVPEIKQNH